MDRIFGGVQLTCGKTFLGSRFQWKIFIATVSRKRPHPRPQFVGHWRVSPPLRSVQKKRQLKWQNLYIFWVTSVGCSRPRRALPTAATVPSHAPYLTCPIHPQKPCESANISPWPSPPPLSLPSSSSPPQANSPSSHALPSLPPSAPLPATTTIPLSTPCQPFRVL